MSYKQFYFKTLYSRQNIFKEGELLENLVSMKFLRIALDGKNYNTKHYNLDMTISLGYRVNSKSQPNSEFGQLNV